MTAKGAWRRYEDSLETDTARKIDVWVVDGADTAGDVYAVFQATERVADAAGERAEDASVASPAAPDLGAAPARAAG